jgi:hypothetical protein
LTAMAIGIYSKKAFKISECTQKREEKKKGQ